MNESDSYILYQKNIDNIAYSYAKHPAILRNNSVDADDLKQELSLAFLKAYRTYNTGKSLFKTHFTNVARHYMIDFMRNLMSGTKHNTRAPSDDGYVTVPLEEAMNIPAADLIGDYETCSTIEKIVVATLPPREASIILMYFGIGSDDNKGMNQQELAEEFGISQQRINVLIKRALTDVDLVTQLQEAFSA